MKGTGGYYLFVFRDEIIFYAGECHLLWWQKKWRLNFQILRIPNPAKHMFSMAERNAEERSRSSFWIDHLLNRVLRELNLSRGIMWQNHCRTMLPCPSSISYLYLTSKTYPMIQCFFTPSMHITLVHVIIIPSLGWSSHVLIGLTTFLLDLPNVSFL